MVQHLRKNNWTQGIGIIISGWHVAAVTVDGPDVCHLPVLELHDGMELKDGALLLMHLLSPTFTRSKAPWFAPQSLQTHAVLAVLPDEVLHHIIYFTDFDTYLCLPLVSHYFRSIYLEHPCIGDHILLSYKSATPNSELIFRVRKASLTDSKLATLKRVTSSMPDSQRALPIWLYDSKHDDNKAIIKPGLSGMFQFHHTGTHPSHPTLTEEIKTSLVQGRLLRRPFLWLTERDEYQSMHVQIMDGVWRMVEDDDEFKVQSGGVSSNVGA